MTEKELEEKHIQEDTVNKIVDYYSIIMFMLFSMVFAWSITLPKLERPSWWLIALYSYVILRRGVYLAKRLFKLRIFEDFTRRTLNKFKDLAKELEKRYEE